MGSRGTQDRTRELDRQIERYRKAAIHALEHLEWCVNYLHRAGRPQIAQALKRNRAQISERAGL